MTILPDISKERCQKLEYYTNCDLEDLLDALSSGSLELEEVQGLMSCAIHEIYRQ